jgi:hypothetical protein
MKITRHTHYPRREEFKKIDYFLLGNNDRIMGRSYGHSYSFTGRAARPQPITEDEKARYREGWEAAPEPTSKVIAPYQPTSTHLGYMMDEALDRLRFRIARAVGFAEKKKDLRPRSLKGGKQRDHAFRFIRRHWGESLGKHPELVDYIQGLEQKSLKQLLAAVKQIPPRSPLPKTISKQWAITWLAIHFSQERD